ncbi:hypothetical protein HY488_03145 [Candidatus Woesearchaeota archaeon]|nr:hypothetical protein [Candidatus Woesearchaeota archaeon]
MTDRALEYRHNLRKHEILGLLFLFFAASLFGLGLYLIMWGANRPIFYGSLDYLLNGKELLLFPLLFGTAAVLWALGSIELREATPGKRRGE